MLVISLDYLRILESGNFINFVAMALCPDEKLSVMQIDDVRLKVCVMCVFVQMPSVRSKSW